MVGKLESIGTSPVKRRKTDILIAPNWTVTQTNHDHSALPNPTESLASIVQAVAVFVVNSRAFRQRYVFLTETQEAKASANNDDYPLKTVGCVLALIARCAWFLAVLQVHAPERIICRFHELCHNGRLDASDTFWASALWPFHLAPDS